MTVRNTLLLLALIYAATRIFAQPTLPTVSVISQYGTLSALTSGAPPANYPVGMLAFTTDYGLVVDNGSAWVAATGYLPSATITMPTTAVLLGCATAQTVAIPNATNFFPVANASPGNVQVQFWITNSGTSSATANIQYCTSAVSVSPSAVTYTIKPFLR